MKVLIYSDSDTSFVADNNYGAFFTSETLYAQKFDNAEVAYEFCRQSKELDNHRISLVFFSQRFLSRYASPEEETEKEEPENLMVAALESFIRLEKAGKLKEALAIIQKSNL